MPPIDHARLIMDHVEAANREDFDALDQLYHDDFVMDLPQSGERMRGKARIRELRSNYPTKVHFVTRRVVGGGSTWVWEGTISYNDGAPMHRVSILEFREGRIARETNYFADSFPAASWRAQYVEKIT